MNHEIGCILLTSPIFFPEEMWIQGPNDLPANIQSGKYYDTTEQAYQQCAVTKEHSIPALEAAHIKPYSLGGFHEVNNGLLLRADIHKYPILFYLFFSISRIFHLIHIGAVNKHYSIYHYDTYKKVRKIYFIYFSYFL